MNKKRLASLNFGNVWGNIKIRTKFLIVFFLTILVSVTSLSVFAFVSISQNITRQSGESMILLAKNTGEQAAQLI